MKKIKIPELKTDHLTISDRAFLQLLRKFDFEKAEMEHSKTLNLYGENENCSTSFSFKSGDGIHINFLYQNNKKVTSITIGESDLKAQMFVDDESDEETARFLNDIWVQFVDRFRLKLRLMFINETIAWTHNNGGR